MNVDNLGARDCEERDTSQEGPSTGKERDKGHEEVDLDEDPQGCEQGSVVKVGVRLGKRGVEGARIEGSSFSGECVGFTAARGEGSQAR